MVSYHHENYSLESIFKRHRQVDEQIGKQYQKYLEKIKWYLWHGNIHKALIYLSYFDDAFFIENDYRHLEGFKKNAADFVTYIQNNQHYITNYGERYRNDEIYTTSFTESTINEVVARRFCKKQQRQWTKKGAHAMLVTRTNVLNNDLADCFKDWYPHFKIKDENIKKTA